MGNAVESLGREKDPTVQDPQVNPAVDHMPDGQDVADSGDEANAGVLPPTGDETLGGSFSDDVVHEGFSHEPDAGLTVYADGCAEVDHTAPLHDSEFDAENQILSSSAKDLIVSHQDSDDADKTDDFTCEFKEIDDCEERGNSGNSVDDVKRRGADSKDEQMKLNRTMSEENQIPESWRCSTASTVTDSSECYQTALEDSDKDDYMFGSCSNRSSAEIDDNGDIDDSLMVTLTESDIRDEIISRVFGGDVRLEKTLSEETVIETDDLKVDSAADETDACKHDDGNITEKALMSDIQVELDSGMELRIGDQSLDQNVDDYPVQHNVVTTPSRAEDEVIPEGQRPQCQDIDVVEDSFKIKETSGHSEKPSIDNQDEHILVETVSCVEPIESSSSGHIFGIDGAEQVMCQQEKTEISSDIHITEEHSNKGMSSSDDITTELQWESVCENVNQPSCTEIGNNTDSDIIDNDSAYIDGSTDNLDHDMRFEQRGDTALALCGTSMPNVKISSEDINKEDDSEAGIYDHIYCRELSGGDTGYSSVQLSETNLGVLATCEGVIVDFGSTVLGEKPEEGFSPVVKFSEDAEVFDDKKRDNVEEGESVHLDESNTEESREQDERLKEEQSGDDDKLTAVALWRDMLATLQAHSEQISQAMTTDLNDSEADKEDDLYANVIDNSESISSEGSSYDILKLPVASLDDDVPGEALGSLSAGDQASNGEEEEEEGDQEPGEPEPGNALPGEATCLPDVVNPAMSGGEEKEEEEELEEPEPDYSQSSEDECTRTLLENFIEMKSSELVQEDIGVPPAPDLLSSSPDVSACEEGFPNVALMALVKPGSVVLDHGLDQASTTEVPENDDSTSEVSQAKTMTETDVIIVDDDDDNHQIGLFQRRTSVRPSKRSRSGNWPKRSASSISSFVPELPEEGEVELGVSEDSVGSESVFEHAETPHSAKLNPWTSLKSMPEDEDSKDSVNVGDGTRMAKTR